MEDIRMKLEFKETIMNEALRIFENAKQNISEKCLIIGVHVTYLFRQLQEKSVIKLK